MRRPASAVLALSVALGSTLLSCTLFRDEGYPSSGTIPEPVYQGPPVLLLTCGMQDEYVVIDLLVTNIARVPRLFTGVHYQVTGGDGEVLVNSVQSGFSPGGRIELGPGRQGITDITATDPSPDADVEDLECEIWDPEFRAVHWLDGQPFPVEALHLEGCSHVDDLLVDNLGSEPISLEVQVEYFTPEGLSFARDALRHVYIINDKTGAVVLPALPPGGSIALDVGHRVWDETYGDVSCAVVDARYVENPEPAILIVD